MDYAQVQLSLIKRIIATIGRGGGGGLLPYKKLMGLCRWIRSHSDDWIDDNEVVFSIE